MSLLDHVRQAAQKGEPFFEVDVRAWFRVLTEPTDAMGTGVEPMEPLGVTASGEHPFSVQRVRTPSPQSEALQSDCALMAYLSRELHQEQVCVCVCVRLYKVSVSQQTTHSHIHTMHTHTQSATGSATQSASPTTAATNATAAPATTAAPSRAQSAARTGGPSAAAQSAGAAAPPRDMVCLCVCMFISARGGCMPHGGGLLHTKIILSCKQTHTYTG